MRHILTRIILLLTVLLTFCGKMGAWDSVQIHGNFESDGTWNDYIATVQPNSDDNVWWLYIDVSGLATGSYWFKVHGEGGNQWFGGEGGTVEPASTNGYANYHTKSNTANDIEFKHNSQYKGYLFKITWWDGNHWNIDVWAACRIDLRDYENVTYIKSNGETEERNITGRGPVNNEYKYFCTWSDQFAWKKPSNIDVFVLSNYTPPTDEGNGNTTAASVQLQKLNIDYIPANVGLILAAKETTDESIPLEKGESGNDTQFNLLREQVSVYNTNQTQSYSGTSLLTPCYEATQLPSFNDNMYNYLFGFYRSKKAGFTDAADNDFALGFWLSSGNGNTYANSAYFQIPKDEAELIGVGTSYDMTNSSSAKPCFLLDFSEEDDVTTGISDALHLNDNEQMINEKGGWYTLDGRRLDGQPTAKGIYICNGKKFIMK